MRRTEIHQRLNQVTEVTFIELKIIFYGWNIDGKVGRGWVSVEAEEVIKPRW